MKRGKAYDTSQCRLCWLWYHNEKYRAKWKDYTDSGTVIPVEEKRSKPGVSNDLRLHFPLCPGDTLVGSSCLEALHTQHPGKYKTDVSGTAAEAIFENNPHVTRLENARTITMKYPLIHQCNQRPIHFIEACTDYLGEKLGIRLTPPTRPSLYLSDEEKGWMNQVEQSFGYKGKYWVVCSGIKSDYTVKGWGHKNYQAVVNKTQGEIQWVQVGELGHNHPLLDGVLDLRGKTDTRQLIRLCYNAQGGLGGVSFLHHIMAAFAKPMVTLASGMEPRRWEEYSTGRMLSRHGALPCCQENSCWKSRVVPLNDKDSKNSNLCTLPVFTPEPLPKCLAMIHPEEVVEAINSYYIGGVLSR